LFQIIFRKGLNLFFSLIGRIIFFNISKIGFLSFSAKHSSKHFATKCRLCTYSFLPLSFLIHFEIDNLFFEIVAKVLLVAFLGLLAARWYYWQKLKRTIEIENAVRERTEELLREKQQLERLLANLMPSETAEELRTTGKASYQHFKEVTVLFSDIQGFTTIAEKTDPDRLIQLLDDLFFHFDNLVEKYHIEKIKTIGDAYMCAGGAPIERNTAPVEVILAALEMLQHLNILREKENLDWNLRLGIHSGPVIAGVVGHKKLSYDIWGDTVNLANRMETASEPNRINISGSTWLLVRDFFECEYRGKLPVKNKAETDMYFVLGIKYNLCDEYNNPNQLFTIKMQLLRLNDLANMVFEKIDNELPSNCLFHTPTYIHAVYCKAVELGVRQHLEPEEQLILGTSALIVHIGMISDYANYIEQSIEFARNILPDFEYQSEQIETICNDLESCITLNVDSVTGRLLLESVYSYFADVNLTARIQDYYLEFSTYQHRISLDDWINLQLKTFDVVISQSDIKNMDFENDPEYQRNLLLSLLT
jgi:class 3 adenylate cyclase